MKGSRRSLHVLGWVLAAAGALVFLGAPAAIVFARGAWLDHYVLPSGSMMPTLFIGDRLFVDKAIYGDGAGPHRGDVVVVQRPDRVQLLKRVVGLPGDVVSVTSGRAAIEGVECSATSERFRAPGSWAR